MKKILTLFIVFSSIIVNAQKISKKVLFIGNSYTFGNDLPQMVSDVVASVGDELIFDSSTQGGYTLQMHSNDPISIEKINDGNWDFVVLQEQSQYPSFPLHQVKSGVYPYAKLLDSIINAKNPCVETVFFMTWGRKNGDAYNCPTWTPVCTYNGMDNLLRDRYKTMANDNNAILSPVGAVWRYVRENHPLIELYESDESHPSIHGTYLAACTFYTTLFRKDPTQISFNSSLSDDEAEKIRNAVKLIVYDNLMEWNIGKFDPVSDFSYKITNNNQIEFTNKSLNANAFEWKFGDNQVSSELNPVYTYQTNNIYTVELIAKKCSISNTTSQIINTIPLNVNEVDITQSNNVIISPNPTTAILYLTHDFVYDVSYKITNITGQIVQKGILNNADKQINVSLIYEGIYFLELYKDDKLLSQQKFIKSSN